MDISNPKATHKDLLKSHIEHHAEHHKTEEELNEFITDLLEACKHARTGYINLVKFEILPSEEYDNESLNIANHLEEVIVRIKKHISTIT